VKIALNITNNIDLFSLKKNSNEGNMLDVEEDWDKYKVFISRVPAHFDESSIKRLMENGLEEENCVVNVSLCSKGDNEAPNNDGELPPQNDNDNQQQQPTRTTGNDKNHEHRGFAFVTLKDVDLQKKALDLGKIRGGCKMTSKKNYTMYIRPVVREGEEQKNKDACYLWINFRCPYGETCKFLHEGEGGCIEKGDSTQNKKKQKCFAFKKGKCNLGDKCLFSHEFEVTSKERIKDCRPDGEKDCINWKTKGKCRKVDKCPYRHDESVRQAFLEKKKKRKPNPTTEEEKSRQPLSVRVYGLNYDTTEDDVKEFFQHCGTIVEITFPRFEDSSRSKGYCGVLFQSPKAVAKAVELDGEELHGRWLRIQAGKMYLRQWDDHHSKDPQKPTETSLESEPLIGEFGQKMKRRKKHGYME